MGIFCAILHVAPSSDFARADDNTTEFINNSCGSQDACFFFFLLTYVSYMMPPCYAIFFVENFLKIFLTNMPASNFILFLTIEQACVVQALPRRAFVYGCASKTGGLMVNAVTFGMSGIGMSAR